MKRDIDAYAARLREDNALLQRAREGLVDTSTVSEYLRGVLHLVRHTPIHLAQAERRASELGNVALADFFRHKASEEVGHDQWAVDDLDALGAEDGQPAGGPPAAIAALVAFLQRTIEEDPRRYLAYVFFAEYFTVVMGPEWIGTLEKSCNIPASALSVVGKHAELDQHHVAEGSREIDGLVREQDLDALRATLFRSMEHYDAFFEELSARVSAKAS